MRDPNQKMRYTDSELSLIKGLFADDAEIAYTIRKVMFQFPLNEGEQSALEAFRNEATKLLMWKTFLPFPDGDSPLFQMSHLALGLGADIKGLTPESAWPFIVAKKVEMDYLTQQLNVLCGDSKPSDVKILLSDLSSVDYPKTKKEEAWCNLTAWNFLMSFIDSNIAQLKVLAGQKVESVAETKARLARDSAQ